MRSKSPSLLLRPLQTVYALLAPPQPLSSSLKSLLGRAFSAMNDPLTRDYRDEVCPVTGPSLAFPLYFCRNSQAVRRSLEWILSDSLCTAPSLLFAKTYLAVPVDLVRDAHNKHVFPPCLRSIRLRILCFIAFFFLSLTLF